MIYLCLSTGLTNILYELITQEVDENLPVSTQNHKTLLSQPFQR